MTDWKKYKLSEIGTLARGKSKHRPRDAAHLYGGKYPFIQTGDVKNANHRVNSYSQTYSDEGLNQSKLWPKDTICITIAANIADTAILNFPACFPDSILGFIARKDKCNVDYIEYMLQYFQQDVQKHSIGSVQENINLGTFQNIEFPLPSLPTQTRIASILSSLDDKIELNRRMNQTLEQMAQALFNHYFVDNIDPDNLPEGWSQKSIVDIISVRDGTHDSPKQNHNGYHLITSKHIKESRIAFNQAYLISETDYKEINRRSKVDTFDILITMISTVGVVHLVSENPVNFAIKNIGLFKTSERIDLFEYIYLYLSSRLMKEFLEARTTGSTQQYLTLQTLRNIPLIIPPENVLRKFKSIVNPIIMKTKSNNDQIEKLIETRNTLLPKLMSGEIDVDKIMDEEQLIENELADCKTA